MNATRLPGVRTCSHRKHHRSDSTFDSTRAHISPTTAFVACHVAFNGTRSSKPAYLSPADLLVAKGGIVLFVFCRNRTIINCRLFLVLDFCSVRTVSNGGGEMVDSIECRRISITTERNCFHPSRLETPCFVNAANGSGRLKC